MPTSASSMLGTSGCPSIMASKAGACTIMAKSICLMPTDREYAAECSLGEARPRIEYTLNHPEWNGQTLTLHVSSP